MDLSRTTTAAAAVVFTPGPSTSTAPRPRIEELTFTPRLKEKDTWRTYSNDTDPNVSAGQWDSKVLPGLAQRLRARFPEYTALQQHYLTNFIEIECEMINLDKKKEYVLEIGLFSAKTCADSKKRKLVPAVASGGGGQTERQPQEFVWNQADALPMKQKKKKREAAAAASDSDAESEPRQLFARVPQEDDEEESGDRTRIRRKPTNIKLSVDDFDFAENTLRFMIRCDEQKKVFGPVRFASKFKLNTPRCRSEGGFPIYMLKATLLDSSDTVLDERRCGTVFMLQNRKDKQVKALQKNVLFTYYALGGNFEDVTPSAADAEPEQLVAPQAAASEMPAAAPTQSVALPPQPQSFLSMLYSGSGDQTNSLTQAPMFGLLDDFTDTIRHPWDQDLFSGILDQQQMPHIQGGILGEDEEPQREPLREGEEAAALEPSAKHRRTT